MSRACWLLEDPITAPGCWGRPVEPQRGRRVVQHRVSRNPTPSDSPGEQDLWPGLSICASQRAKSARTGSRWSSTQRDNRWNKFGRRFYCLSMAPPFWVQRQRLDLLHAAAIDMRRLVLRSLAVLEESEHLLARAAKMDATLIDRTGEPVTQHRPLSPRRG